MKYTSSYLSILYTPYTHYYSSRTKWPLSLCFSMSNHTKKVKKRPFYSAVITHLMRPTPYTLYMTHNKIRERSHPMAPAPTRNTLDDPSLRCKSVPYTAICPSYLHPWGATRAADRGCKTRGGSNKMEGLGKVEFRIGRKEGRMEVIEGSEEARRTKGIKERVGKNGAVDGEVIEERKGVQSN